MGAPPSMQRSFSVLSGTNSSSSSAPLESTTSIGTPPVTRGGGSGTLRGLNLPDRSDLSSNDARPHTTLPSGNSAGTVQTVDACRTSHVRVIARMCGVRAARAARLRASRCPLMGGGSSLERRPRRRPGAVRRLASRRAGPEGRADGRDMHAWCEEAAPTVGGVSYNELRP
eukprot:1239360-Prymnesium_polylepis.2